MKIYMAGPLFSVAERLFNLSLAKKLRARGHEVRLPQQLAHTEPAELYRSALAGVRWSDVVLACADGADPDSGTAVECGYALGVGRPVVVYRTDFRAGGDGRRSAPSYNLMLAGLATVNVAVRYQYQDPPSVDEVFDQLLGALWSPALRKKVRRAKGKRSCQRR